MNLLQGASWNAMRVLRVSLGFMAGVAGMVYRDPLVAALGGVTFLQGIFNLSCCGVGGCSVPAPPATIKETTEIEYETIKK